LAFFGDDPPAVMAASYLPVLTPARMPASGRISCLISNGAYFAQIFDHLIPFESGRLCRP